MHCRGADVELVWKNGHSSAGDYQELQSKYANTTLSCIREMFVIKVRYFHRGIYLTGENLTDKNVTKCLFPVFYIIKKSIIDYMCMQSNVLPKISSCTARPEKGKTFTRRKFPSIRYIALGML